MMGIILVQEVIVKWTTGARGGEAATRRNALPEAVLLPQMPAQPYPLTLIHDKVEFYKEPHHQMTVKEMFPRQPFFEGCTSVSWDDERVNVIFTYNATWGGAPFRTSYPRQVLTLSPGTWGRIRYNGRFSTREGGWWYRKSVLNIGYFDTLVSKNIFLTEPYKIFSDMADLW